MMSPTCQYGIFIALETALETLLTPQLTTKPSVFCLLWSGIVWQTVTSSDSDVPPFQFAAHVELTTTIVP